VLARGRALEEAIFKVVPSDRHLLPLDGTGLVPTRCLAAEAVEFAAAAEDTERAPGRVGRDEADEKIVRVRGEDDCARIRKLQLIGDVGLGSGPDLAHHPVPLAVGEPGCVLPGGDLTDIARVRPEVMAVRSGVESIRRRGQGALEEVLVAGHRRVLSDQSSGKARLASVCSR